MPFLIGLSCSPIPLPAPAQPLLLLQGPLLASGMEGSLSSTPQQTSPQWQALIAAWILGQEVGQVRDLQTSGQVLDHHGRTSSQEDL